MASSPLRSLLHPGDEARMTLIEHLDELRSRILKIGIIFVLASIVAWFFRGFVFDFLMAPAPDSMGSELQFTNITDPIFTDFKLALYTGLMVTLPVLFYQIWAFIAPAVGEMGRLFTYTLISMASLLFVGGVAFGYYLVMPIALNVLIGWDPSRFSEIITANAYLQFITRLLLAFGVAFEVPAATYVGAKLGLVDANMMKKFRRHSLLAIAILAAVITPAEPFSMIMMTVALYALYEVSIIIAAKVNPVPAVTLPEAMEQDEKDREMEEAGSNRDDR